MAGVLIICALGSNRAIGRGNALLWRLPSDLKRFKTLTLGHPIVMGRKTYDSIGRPLPGRTNIVITRNPGWQAAGCVPVTSWDAARAVARQAPGGDEVFVIGGAQIYALALADAERLYLTEVADAPVDADAFFPEFTGFYVTERSAVCQEGGVSYRFSNLRRLVPRRGTGGAL